MNTFWRKIYSELVIVFGSDITFKWDELLFGLTHSRTMDVHSRYLFGVLSVAARKAITKRWLKPDAPSLEDWFDITYEIFVMERITFSLKLQQSKFGL